MELQTQPGVMPTGITASVQVHAALEQLLFHAVVPTIVSGSVFPYHALLGRDRTNADIYIYTHIYIGLAGFSKEKTNIKEQRR
jgi:hypothetical protein